MSNDIYDIFEDPVWDTCPICKHAKITISHDWRCDEIAQLRNEITILRGEVNEQTSKTTRNNKERMEYHL